MREPPGTLQFVLPSSSQSVTVSIQQQQSGGGDGVSWWIYTVTAPGSNDTGSFARCRHWTLAHSPAVPRSLCLPWSWEGHLSFVTVRLYPSVRLSVKRVNCDKTKETSAHILIPLWKIDFPSFPTGRIVGGDDSLYLKFGPNWHRSCDKRRFSFDIVS